MAYLSDFVKSTLSRVVLGKEIPSFAYNVGDRVDSFDSTIWSLHRGTKKVWIQWSMTYRHNRVNAGQP
jgi:SCY1-like protein 1